MEKLSALLNEYAELPEYIGIDTVTVTTKSLFGDYPIHIAATRGNSSDIKLLLSNGANVNSIGEHGATPLHNAVEQGHFKVIELLLKKGANGALKNSDGDTPLKLAKLLQNDEIYQYLQLENSITKR